jgi:hypothetical protein
LAVQQPPAQHAVEGGAIHPPTLKLCPSRSASDDQQLLDGEGGDVVRAEIHV